MISDDDFTCLVVIFVIMPIAVVLGLEKTCLDWYGAHINVIRDITVVVAVVLGVLYMIATKNVLCGIASIFATSQLVFFLVYFGIKIANSQHSGFFGTIGPLVIFVVYVIYVVFNCWISFVLQLESLPEYWKKKQKNKEDNFDIITMNGCIGIIGWVINGVFFWIF